MRTDVGAIERAGWIDLRDGEEVVGWINPHRIVNWLPYLTGALLTVLGLLLLLLVGEFGLLVGAFGALFLLVPWLRRRSKYYVLTTERCVKKTGILNRSSDEIEYVEMAEAGRADGTIGKAPEILGGDTYDSMRVKSGSKSIDLNYVPSPDEFADALADRIRRAQERQGRTADTAADAPTTELSY